jgi:hypothetical protein
MKSGFDAHRGAFRRLTGVLPDVAKSGVRQRGVIRNWPMGEERAKRRARDCAETM